MLPLELYTYSFIRGKISNCITAHSRRRVSGASVADGSERSAGDAQYGMKTGIFS